MAEKNIKIVILETFNGNVNGESKHFQAGEEVEIDEAIGREFARAGFVKLLDQKAVKIVNPPQEKNTKAVKNGLRDTNKS